MTVTYLANISYSKVVIVAKQFVQKQYMCTMFTSSKTLKMLLFALPLNVRCDAAALTYNIARTHTRKNHAIMTSIDYQSAPPVENVSLRTSFKDE